MINEWTNGLQDDLARSKAEIRTLKTQMVDFEFNASVIMEQLRREKRELADALKAMTNRYVDLVESGDARQDLGIAGRLDAGFWDPELETEVQQARKALKNYSDES